VIFITDEFKPLLANIAAAPEIIFSDPAIKPWRTLPDRQNCIWDLQTPRGIPVRLHVKRFPARRLAKNFAKLEAAGYQALQARGIPTANLAAWGTCADGRSFIATADLQGFTPADKLIESGQSFAKLLNPTAAVAAKLHNAGLHHRDLYLCHFLARCGNENEIGNENENDNVELRLIDAARVRPLPAFFTRRRWIVKDLAQFWFSTLPLAITAEQRAEWLEQYATATRTRDLDRLRRAIERKSTTIAAHDRSLRHKQPGRNISIPG
jgi:heptose I phosphotransferase